MGWQKIGKDRLGALEGTQKILGCFDGPEPLSQVISKKVANWKWKSVSQADITPDYYAVTLFIKHAKAFVPAFFMKRFQLGKIDIDASIIAVMIGNIIFLKDSYPTTEMDLDIDTDDKSAITMRGNIIKGVFRGIFDFNTCSYYHVLGSD